MDLTSLEQRATAELAACADEAALRAWNTTYFGKQGEVVQAVAKLKEVPPAEKPAYGKEVNRIKVALTAAYEAALAQVAAPAPNVPGLQGPHGPGAPAPAKTVTGPAAPGPAPGR